MFSKCQSQMCSHEMNKLIPILFLTSYCQVTEKYKLWNETTNRDEEKQHFLPM